MAETKKKTARRAKEKEAPAPEEILEEKQGEISAEGPLPSAAQTPSPEGKAGDPEMEALKALVKQLQEQLAAQKPHVVQVMADTERVVMRFQAEVADDNVAVFGPEGMYGQVTGKTGTITVPKSEWSRFYNESVRNMIARRWLIVLSGMDERERDLYGCNYRPGEILDEMAFHKLLDLGRDLIAIFPVLCREHQAMVASRFLTAWMDGDERARDRDLIVALNEMSKENFKDAGKNDVRKKGLFWPIIEEMNAKDAE